ncbi:DUF262 domain-containing protein [Gluconacetobacter sp. 1b LMG 1731]|uniref:DUF262 domain-containing protein n=1 Tax=Gluconacetobacter dulcium TaxID=2729096 RepID=A0A7W4ILV2_9PROT|nr:DUF262 domain-containing protein [Gluconacetobacter dulcium]MBB2165231.1 DUF262 domain-containing protein [Gluconacetobacter dulcium]MBB2194360.1 DUF262 domain-containing protein [Gluconacetobacter dulcium]
MALEPIDSRLIGIGALLKQQRLAVPTYQRPYTWEIEHVKELFKDIIDAKQKKHDQYFLGTVVLTNADDSIKSIIDGQQRIVTTSIFISSIRNYFKNKGDDARANKLTADYISNADLRTMNPSPRVLILPDDQSFYNEYVVGVPTIGRRSPRNLTDTQKRLFSAIREARDTINSVTAISKNPDLDLFDLIDFIEKKVVLVYLDVGSESNAYVIFEVLNDRGLDLTVADLLKNYVFSMAGKEGLLSCQSKWKEMTTLISNTNGEGDIRNFIRHDWISRNGLVREKNLYDSIKKSVYDEKTVSDYMDNIIVSANIYSSFSIFSSSVWKDYSDKVRKSLMLFDMANITQVRPLLLSVFSNFSVQEVNKTIPMIASWSVRFLICGAGGSGVLEDNYAQRAKDVSDKKIKNATDLFNSFNILPTDIQFQKDFESAKVSKTQLARWYLSELELEKTKNAQKIVNPDTLEVNLEHILPHNPDSSWSISQNLASKCVNMIGNLALMEAKTNSIIGNSSFDDKKSHFSQSSFDLTKEISNFKSWGSQEIEKRQVELAKLAVKRWKNKP